MVDELTMNEVECRVVGSLIEKSFLTPDIYPMTTNALVSASNQKTARDPVVSYDAVTIDGALLELRQRNLVRRVHTPGSRATKHRHALDDALDLDEADVALIAVLLLRGDQTIGELRQRTDRMHEFGSLDEVEDRLEALSRRDRSLTVQLPRRPGQKEARWRHLLGDPDAVPPAEPSAAPVPAASRTIDAAPTATDALADRVEALEATVSSLTAKLAKLADALGEDLD